MNSYHDHLTIKRSRKQQKLSKDRVSVMCGPDGGGWRMADGGWRMADGGWRMANGGWRMADDKMRIIKCG